MIRTLWSWEVRDVLLLGIIGGIFPEAGRFREDRYILFQLIGLQSLRILSQRPQRRQSLAVFARAPFSSFFTRFRDVKMTGSSKYLFPVLGDQGVIQNKKRLFRKIHDSVDEVV